MSLIDRLSGRKPNGNGTTPAATTGAPATPESLATPTAPAPPSPAVHTNSAGTSAAARLSSSMYSTRSLKGDPEKLSAVDQLKIDLHHRLIERLDLEALEQIKDEVEVVHQIRLAVGEFLREE